MNSKGTVVLPDKTQYMFYKVLGLAHAVRRKIAGRTSYSRKKYNGRKIKSDAEGNDILRNAILSGKPYMAARFGDGELRTMLYALEIKLGLRASFPDYITHAISCNAGFFPVSTENLLQFGDVMMESCSELNCIAVWYNLMEDYFIRQFAIPNIAMIPLRSLEPFWFSEPWSAALAGKKVLVVHPFAKTIKNQYLNRVKLFRNPSVLPSFELSTIQAVQSLGGTNDQFSNWFEALDYMTMEARKVDFDVAIIGCGAYGLPLAARIKQLGKVAIHMGGVTQFLFGIKGRRWDVRSEYSSMYNDYWCRPNDRDRPTVANKVEGGCYW